MRRSRPETLTQQAKRTDPDTGVEEVAEFIGPKGSRILAFMSKPGSPKGGVLICSSVHAEQVAAYRKEVLLARRLAAEGYAVMRFSYRGAGNSEGATSDLSLETMHEDATRAASALEERADVEISAAIGTRLGALVATKMMEHLQGGALALWEPVVSGKQFLREAFRARALRRLKEGGDGTQRDDPIAEIREKGWADVLGYPVGSRLYESLESAALEDHRIPASGDVLLVQIAGADTLRRPLAALAERLRTSGRRVTTLNVQDDESWWFPRQPFSPEETNAATRRLLDETSAWIVSLR